MKTKHKKIIAIAAVIGIIMLLVWSIPKLIEMSSDEYKIKQEWGDIGVGDDKFAYYVENENRMNYYGLEYMTSDNLYQIISYAEENITPNNYYCRIYLENNDARNSIPGMKWIYVTNYLYDGDEDKYTSQPDECMCNMEINFVPSRDEFLVELPSIKYLECAVNCCSENGTVTDAYEFEFLECFPDLKKVKLTNLKNGIYELENSQKNIDIIKTFIPDDCEIEMIS